MSSEKRSIQQLSTNPEICLGEANLAWDEYKYRHDLIWRHLIRSTIAVIALITVAYSNNFESNQTLFIIAALLAVIYTIFSYIILDCELICFDKIKKLHRQRQNDLYRLHCEIESKDIKSLDRFPTFARIYLAGLLVLTLGATVSQVFSI